MHDDPSQPEDAAPAGQAAADSTPTDPPGQARSPGDDDRSTQLNLSAASLRHLTEVAEAFRRIAVAHPPAVKVIGGTSLGLLAQANLDHRWAGVLAARPAAAKLHGDLSGISKLSQQLAHATAGAAGWRVGLGRSDRVAQAATGTAGWRAWPAQDLKLGAKFTVPLALKVTGGSALALLAPASKGQRQWAGLLDTRRTATFQHSLAAATRLNERFVQAVLAHPRPVGIGLAGELDTEQVAAVVRREAQRRAAAYQADAAVPQLLTQIEGQAHVLVSISEAIDELLTLARSARVAQQAEATFNRWLQLALLLATLATLLLAALGYLDPREASPAAPARPAPTTTVAGPHAGVPPTATPGAGDRGVGQP